MSYDSVCMNIECFTQKNSFFVFDFSNPHITSNHRVKSLHPLTYASYFPKTSQNIIPPFSKNQMCASLARHREEAFSAVVEAVRMLFYQNKLISSFQQALPYCQNINIKSILAQLSQGNYAILQKIRHFEMQDKEQNFQNFVIQSIKQTQQQIKGYFYNLKNIFLDKCAALQKDNGSEQYQPNIQQQKIISTCQKHNYEQNKKNIEQKQIQEKEAFIPTQQIKEIPVKLEEIQNFSPFDVESEQKHQQPMEQDCYEDQHEIDEESNENVSQEKDRVQIDQQNKQFPRFQHRFLPGSIFFSHPIKPKKKKRRRRRRNYSVSDGINILSHEEIIVNYARNPLKTVIFLQETFPFLTTLHIFHEKMATDLILKRILSSFPKIKRITLNCSHQLKPELFKQVSEDIRKTLTIQFKWDMSKFFTEYFAEEYFPYRPIKKRQRQEMFKIRQIKDLIPNNNSIWQDRYTDGAQIEDLNQKTIISTIRFRNNMWSNFRNIKVLILQGVSLDQESKFIEMLMSNNQIETIIFKQCYFQDQINNILQQMDKLSHLSKLSIQDCSQIINPHLLFNLVHLTHLNFQYCRFLKSGNQNQWANWSGLSQLTQLKHLNLYDSGYQNFNGDYSYERQTFNSQIFTYLCPTVISSLIYLNVEQTNVDNAACQFIKKMSSLQYLNISRTNIQGHALVDAFSYMARQNCFGVPLKYLNIRRCRYDRSIKFTQQNLQQLAKYLVKLVYINIGLHNSLLKYNFADFKSLKTIAMTKSQYQSLDQIISPEINRYKLIQ